MSEMLAPIVSIITPAYNSRRFISDTIESVKSQTYTAWEMIVVDDCSFDNTCEVVEQKAKLDERIRLIRVDKNSGPAIARNIALEAASGRYIAFLDSDDIWLPQKLERQIAFMQQGGIAFSYTNYRRMREQGDLYGKLIKLPLSLDYWGLLKNTGIAGCLTVMIDREMTGDFWMPDLPHGEDLVLWLQLIKKGFTAFGLSEDLARYRIVGNSTSRNKRRAAKEVWRVYRDIEKLGFLPSSWCFINYAWSALQKSRSL
jgi:teichuronic acid biosynthesis glycosyltransferase TuaG